MKAGLLARPAARLRQRRWAAKLWSRGFSVDAGGGLGAGLETANAAAVEAMVLPSLAGASCDDPVAWLTAIIGQPPRARRHFLKHRLFLAHAEDATYGAWHRRRNMDVGTCR